MPRSEPPSPAPPSSGGSPLARLRVVRRRDRQGCRHCDSLLLLCPLGPACPGSSLISPPACTQCSWGLRCPVHGLRWTTA